MSRIIMLIPLDQKVGLNTVSLSIMYYFNIKQNSIYHNKSKKSILYFSCIKNELDYSTFIINKYFSNIIHTIKDIDFSKLLFQSSDYLSLFTKIMDICHQQPMLYELIFIKGINKYDHIHSEEINYDLAINLNAEVIFVDNLKNDSISYITNKEKKINFFLHEKKYKNILGIIFNKIHDPFLIEKQCSFIKKLRILKESKNQIITSIIPKTYFKNNFLKIIAYIPWNRNIMQIHVLDILNFLNIKYIHLINKSTHIIEEIMIFDESDENILSKTYCNTLIIISFSRIENFIDMIKLLDFKKNKIRCIILTGTAKLKENIIFSCQLLIKKSISIFFTNKNTIEILSKLHDFDFNLKMKDKIYIKKLQKFISSFFNVFDKILLHKKNKTISKTYAPKEFCYYIKLFSRKKNKRIILPESYEVRILQATSICYSEKIAQCILLGDAKKIYQIAYDNNIHLSKKIEIINPDLVKNKYISRLVELRKNKGMNEYIAEKKIKDNNILATLILEDNQVDGLVSGSINTTSNTIRPAFQIIKTYPNNTLVSSIFFMLLSNSVLIYGDCAINVAPNAEELASIAIQSADSAKIFNIEPRIAMLSYSTGDSGAGYQVEKVRQATNIVRHKRPDLIIDGPIQYDAAVSETISQLKAPYSPILGSANIFIFPDLNSGNIAYKAVQRSANIISIGPMLQGLRKPVNDLSRGASIEEIIYTIALTSIQAK
ncbi:phosphate acetyltransferase [Buchnera aphidicola]|uniref:Phosphate acetyltransferase n=1 Tax=Buchnera aphidicola subsp. Uroleucon sonchi TaxID=118118 RepID=A0A6C1FBP7_BUCUN|nr:phosphate acetyltransferase [Buchnera aphidicola]QIE01916.1 phosphate acetyltransferase [Buchnera aphidicola (Uroleucon sonchi)]